MTGYACVHNGGERGRSQALSHTRCASAQQHWRRRAPRSHTQQVREACQCTHTHTHIRSKPHKRRQRHIQSDEKLTCKTERYDSVVGGF